MSKNIVLVVSMGLSAIIGIWAVVSPDDVTTAAVALTSGAMQYLDWLFMMTCTMFVFLCVYLAVTPYGEIKLGRDDEEPEFSTASWIATNTGLPGISAKA